MSDVIVQPGYNINSRGTPRNMEMAANLVPVATAAAANSQVLKATPAMFYGANCCSTGAAGFMMLFDAAAQPADGAVTPKKVWPVAAGAAVEVGYQIPLRMAVGAVLVFSSTGPFVLTAAPAFLSGEVI